MVLKCVHHFLRPFTVSTRFLPSQASIQLHLQFQARRSYSNSSKPPPSIDDADPSKVNTKYSSNSSYTQPSEDLSQRVTPAERAAYDRTFSAHVRKQQRSPWLRDGAQDKPADRIKERPNKDSDDESADTDTDSDSDRLTSPTHNAQSPQGKLLTTPSRLLKLVIPVASRQQIKRDIEEDGRQDLEPLALLVHPQQPLSYLERLVQSELPTIRTEDGVDKIPVIVFKAPESSREEEDADESEDADRDGGEDVTVIDGKKVRTGKVTSTRKKEHDDASAEKQKAKQKKETEHDVKSSKSFSLPDPENNPASSDPSTFVKWSGSTEIGDFIRDAARAKYFALEIEGAPEPILVGVPSFQDRTYYLRMRLRQRSREIVRFADIKKECDDIAEKGAKTVAFGGGVALVVYWIVVYLCTFRSDLGWDVMEPVTYLVSLSAIIGGYMWFLVHNRQVSYRSAMKYTVSRRQQYLYDQKGFDLQRWEELMVEGNKLRREIKMIAEEYNVEWDEKQDAKSDKVIKALEKERKQKKEEKKAEKEEKDSD